MTCSAVRASTLAGRSSSGGVVTVPSSLCCPAACLESDDNARLQALSPLLAPVRCGRRGAAVVAADALALWAQAGRGGAPWRPGAVAADADQGASPAPALASSALASSALASSALAPMADVAATSSSPSPLSRPT